MLIVALTGGIATGKTVVAEVFKSLGCYIEESDQIAHSLMAADKPAWKKIVAYFGQKILKEDRSIDREKLGGIVFSDKKKLEFLNRTVHPLVLKQRKNTINRLKKTRSQKIYISEAALTIEAGFTAFYDKIVLVWCRKNVQIDRLMKRDGIDRIQALSKINSQMPSQQKKKYADYIIDSSGSIGETIEQAERIFRNLMWDYSVKLEKPSA